ncbi:polyprotein [Pyrenophora tritici-repentis]|nr:polyprotein [Pyrenophora tritici-repentis]
MASSSRRVVPTLEALLGTTNIKPREWHHIDPEIWEDNVEAPDDEVGITTATTYIARAIADYTDRPTADEELFWEFRQDFEGWTEAMFLRAQPIYTKELKRILRFKGVYTGRINMAPSESLARLLRMEEYLEWPQDVFQSAVFDTRSAAHIEGSVQSTDRRLSSQAQSRTQTPVRTRGRDVDSRQTRDQDQTHARVQGRQETVEEEQQIQDQLAKTIEKAQNQPIRSQPVETTESAPQPAYQRVQSQQPPLTYNNFDRFRDRGGPKSWIYRHGWAVWHRKYKKNYWLCRYCHQRRKQEACYEADSTTNAGRHLSSNKPGHSHGPNGPVPIASREGNIMGALAKSQVYIMRSKGIEVSQEVANEIAASFSTSRFQDALKDWVVADNQSLRVIETPQFRAMIAAVSPLAEALLWPVANYLREARSLIHVSFDNWTSTATRAHTGNNIAAAATTILRLFGVDNARVGYFVLDNASNNDTAVESLAEEFGFIASERRLRCCCHILNLSAQLVIWGKDRSAYENEAAHLEEEEKYMDEWRKYGPVGVLFDVIASILRGGRVSRCYTHIRQLVKPVKTRWNSYFNTFVRAAELHGPIDGYIECKLEEHSAATATSRRRKNREQPCCPATVIYTRRGLSGKDWATITEYIRLLEPFAEATRLLEGRGRHGRHGAIWEVLVTFEWLLDQLEALKDRLKDVNYEDLDAPEDHLITNVNLAHCKLAEYYAKFDNAPVYYTATILHPHYKHHLSALWKVPDTHVTARDGVHYRDGWLDNNHRAFLRMWQGRKDSAATSAHTVTPPPAAADCERTFSELGDMLGTRRLHMKPELISALQSLKSWKRLEEEISKVQEHLSQFDVRISISFDLWTSPNPYAILGVVAMWIDTTGMRRVTALGMRRIYGEHTGENLGSVVLELLEEYDISGDQIGYFMLDNASANDTAVEFILRISAHG